MTHVAHLAIRNRGTIGGSLSHADPAAELPMMAVLLDAELRVVSAAASARSRRATSSAMRSRSISPRTRSSPRSRCRSCRRDTGWGFEEVARRSGDFALAAVAVTLTLSDGSDRAGAYRHDRRRADARGVRPMRRSCSSARGSTTASATT